MLHWPEGCPAEPANAAFIRATGIKAMPRGNASHQLTFELCRVTEGVADAFRQRLQGIATLPRTMADVLIGFADGTGYRLRNAAVRAWPGGQEQHLTRERITLLGGDLVPDAGTYTPGQSWGSIGTNWEELG